jgi:ATP-dependent helicase YprA (DUF1998 family)
MESTPDPRPQEPPELDSLNPLLQTEVTELILANVKTIRALTPERLPEFTRNLIPQDRMPTTAFMKALSPSERMEALLACLLVWTLSNSTVVPREFQLKVALAAISGRDTVVRAGTGQGKTLAMVILMLLRPDAMAMIISPLKHLQSTQEESPELRFSKPFNFDSSGCSKKPSDPEKSTPSSL